MVEAVGRVFAAVPVPVEIRIALADRLAGLDLPGRLVEPEDWHVTLRFFGGVSEIVYERLLHGMAPVADVQPFKLSLDLVGAFPSARKASVLWLGIGQGIEELTGLSQVVEEAAVSAGLEREERPFQPHLTLSRVRPPQDVSALMGGDIGLKWKCDRVVVYSSKLGESGPKYSILETFLLDG